MPQLIFPPSARQDLVGIFDFISHNKPVAASNWSDLIEEKCKLIAATPAFGEQRSEFGSDIRNSLVGRYVIFYRMIDASIEVVRVISGDAILQQGNLADYHLTRTARAELCRQAGRIDEDLDGNQKAVLLVHQESDRGFRTRWLSETLVSRTIR